MINLKLPEWRVFKTQENESIPDSAELAHIKNIVVENDYNGYKVKQITSEKLPDTFSTKLCRALGIFSWIILAPLWNDRANNWFHGRQIVVIVERSTTTAAIHSLSSTTISSLNDISADESDQDLSEVSEDIPSLLQGSDATRSKPYEYIPDGADHIDENNEFTVMGDYAAKFVEAVKNKEINVKTTHLQFMCQAVRHNFDTIFPENKISTYGDNDRILIRQFKKEMEYRISSNQVTYEWWVLFNLRLSILVTPPDARSNFVASEQREDIQMLMQNSSWKSHEKTVEALQKQEYANISIKPLDILKKIEAARYFLYPSCQGEFKIKSMNDVYTTHLWPIGLTSTPVMGDGRLMWPDQFFRHDLVHLDNLEYVMIQCNSDIETMIAAHTKHELISNFFLDISNTYKDLINAEDLKKIEELVETIYFRMWHENYATFGILENYFRQRNQSFPLHLSTSSIKSLSNKELIYRSDWLGDYIPDPKSLGFDSMKDMITYCESLLQILIQSKDINDVKEHVVFSKDKTETPDMFKINGTDKIPFILHLNANIWEVEQWKTTIMTEESRQPPSDRNQDAVKLRLPENPENPRAYFTTLTLEELGLYNAVVKAINAKNPQAFEDAVNAGIQNSNVENVLIKQGIIKRKNQIFDELTRAA